MTRKEARWQGARSRAEWVALGASLLVLLAVLAPLVVEHLIGGTASPIIVVEPRLDQVQQQAGGYSLPVTVANQGDQTAEDLSVRLLLTLPDGSTESVEFELRVLAGGASAEATVLFQRDPTTGPLTHTASFFKS